MEPICERTICSLNESAGLEAEHSSHLSVCEECQAVERSLKLLSAERPHYFSSSSPSLCKKVTDRAVEIISDKESGRSLLDILSDAALSWRIAAGFVSLAVIAALLVWTGVTPDHKTVDDSRDAPLTVSVPDVQLRYSVDSADSESLVFFPIEQPFDLDGIETVSLSGPDGSSFEFQGPGRVTINQRGFHLAAGAIRATVSKAPGNFLATTPHCSVEVLSTIFSIEVLIDRSVVSVEKGRIRVTDNAMTVEKVLCEGDSEAFLVPETSSTPARVAPDPNME